MTAAGDDRMVDAGGQATAYRCRDCGYRPFGSQRPTGSCFGCRGDFTWEVVANG